MTQELMSRAEYEAMRAAEDDLWWYAGLRSVVMVELRRHVPPPARLLDAGCGTGRNLLEYERAGYHATGLDLSPDALRHSRNRGIERIHRAGLLALPHPDNRFDAVTCLDVLGILDHGDQVLAMREVLRVLRPGGTLIVHAAAYRWLWSSHDDAVNWKERFTRAGLLSLLREAGGAAPVRCTYRVTLLFPAVVLAKLASRRRSANEASHQQATPGWLNGLLTKVQAAESGILRVTGLPFGSSLLLVARKAEH